MWGVFGLKLSELDIPPMLKKRNSKKKGITRRQRMYITNSKVKDWLIRENYDNIWFKPHLIRPDFIYTQSGGYNAHDLFNLFDGLCFSDLGNLIYLQMKTNQWPKEEPIIKFCNTYPNSKVLVFNYTNKLKKFDCKWTLLMRSYKS